MLDALDEPGARELERVLRARLFVPAPAAERRVSELGFLSELLESRGQPHFLGFSFVPRRLYDRERPGEAPLSKRLVERFHSWLEACRAAGKLNADGRSSRGAGRPWAQRRDESPVRFTREDVLQAIRDCARDQGCTPSSSEYVRWCNAKREHARRVGTATVPPTIKTLYRFYPASEGGWTVAVASALGPAGEAVSSTVFVPRPSA